jgi:hypothetical protein
MRHAVRLFAATGSIILLTSLAACGDDRIVTGSSIDTTVPDTTVPDTTMPDTTIPAPYVALTWADDGGCVVMGPNCPTYVLWSNGTVEISRTGEDTEPEVTGTIPESLVATWLASVAGLDAAALADEVGPGSCNSCVDGADTLLTVRTANGDVTLDSTEMAFDTANEFFADLERLMTEVRAVGELPLIDRT